MQAVLDKYNLIYKAQADQVRKSEDDFARLDGNVRESASALLSGLGRGQTNLMEESDKTQWLYF